MTKIEDQAGVDHIHMNELWEKEIASEVITKLKQGFSLQEIIDSKNLEKPLGKATKVTCCDDRCEHGLSVAGSGMLMPEEAFDNFMKANPDSEVITYHPDCGASYVAFAIRQKAGTLPAGVTTPAELAKHFAETMAKKYGKKCECIRADGSHKGLGVFVDLTNEFNPDLVAGMPHMYVTQSASSGDYNYLKTEITTLMSVASGDHGFVNNYTEQDPLYVMLCLKEPSQKEYFTALAKEAVNQYGNKVLIESFVSPL